MSQQGNLVGQTLGQYQIVELVGEGGMAAIYKAWQPSLKRYVALKVLAPRLSNESEFLKRFHQEAVAAANLKHTHIVTVYDVGVEGDYHYMAMEFIEGTSLQERLRSGQAFTLDEVVDVVSQIGAALDYAHQRGFIHRDIKPANILIESSGRAVLTDFGIVKALSESGVTSALTQAGTIVGTPQYMSPEQVKDEPLDHRSDLYSLGIVCFEMLSGQVPFDGTTTHAILYAQVNTPPPPLRKFAGLEVPAPVEAAMNKMLAKDRDSRYNSAGEFARDLAQAVAGVWPAGIGGETAVVGHMGSGTTVAGGAAGGVTVPATKQPAGPPTPPPTVRQPSGPPTPPPAAWQPVGPPTPPPAYAPAHRRRSSLALEVGIAAAIVLILGGVAAALVLGRWYPLRSAQDALTAGDYARAVEGFTRVLERNPDQEQAIAGLLDAADNLSQAGQFDAAIAAYETVERVKPDEARVLQGLGQAYEAKGEWEQAAGWYEKWTQVAPDDRNAFLALGNARFNLEEYERAVAAYERAISLGAGAVEVDTHLGLAYFELARYDKAVEWLQNAMSQDPEDFQLQRAFGLSLYAQGQTEQAIGYLNKTVALGVDRPGDELMDVYYALGSCYFAAQDHEQAIRFYEQAQALDPEGRSMWAGEARANLDTMYVENAMEDMLLDLDFSNVVTEGDEAYAIAKTGQKVEIRGPVRLLEGPWEGGQALVVEEGGKNWVINPSFEVDVTTGWASSGGLVVSHSNEQARFGEYSAKCVTDGNNQFFRTDVTDLTASTTYNISGWIYVKSGSCRIELYDDGGFDNGQSLGVFGAQDEWVRWSTQRTTDVGVTGIRIWIRDEADVSTWYNDGIQVEETSYGSTYCDGDQGHGYSWSGTPHASTSMRDAMRIDFDPVDDTISQHEGSILLQIRPVSDDGIASSAMILFEVRGSQSWSDSLLRIYRTSTGDVVAILHDSSPIRVSKLVARSVASTGKETMVLLTYGRAVGTVRLYVNGELKDAYSGVPWGWGNWAYGFLGGNLWHDTANGRANAVFSRWVTFDRALTASEVEALYRTDSPVSK